jgi:hypothetical protein
MFLCIRLPFRWWFLKMPSYTLFASQKKKTNRVQISENIYQNALILNNKSITTGAGNGLLL